MHEILAPRQSFEHIDRLWHAFQARTTGGISPIGVMLAYTDWLHHLANAPGKQFALGQRALEDAAKLSLYALRAGTDDERPPFPDDRLHRFDAPGWEHWPYNLYAQGFLAVEQWWDEAARDVRGAKRQHLEAFRFLMRQTLNRLSPANLPWTNPEVVERTFAEGGANLWRGAEMYVEDLRRVIDDKPPVGSEQWVVGRDVAVTAGKVVYRNDLIELIQYAPTTDQVRPEPVLVVPAWIMKYYILDLEPKSSLIRWLVDQGFTVFAISWKNPDRHDAHLGLDDYRRLGIMAALDVVNRIVPDQPVHACGYCLGGTLMAIAAAAMARDADDRLASMTLLAGQTDFSEAGELMVFIDESELAYLEDMMWDQGYLDSRQMAGAFQLLRSHELIWSKLVRTYLMGEREALSAMMAWNADGTRMPAQMQTEYLRDLFLDNRLSRGRFAVEGSPVVLEDVRVPMFVVGTEKDHIAPWQSVYKVRLLTHTHVTFALAAGGHNSGIVSRPGHPKARYKLGELEADAAYVPPERWTAGTQWRKGSWWEAWTAWLHARSGESVTPRQLGMPGQPLVADAPGSYVLQR